MKEEQRVYMCVCVCVCICVQGVVVCIRVNTLIVAPASL